jgi:LuxR family transcriptional regulator, regulator of acetate metabolism
VAGRANSEVLAQVEALSQLVDERHGIAALIDRTAVLREASHRIRERTGLDLGYAAELGGPDLLVIRGWSGVAGTSLRNLEVPRGLGLGGKSFALERPVWVPDYCSSAAITHEFDSVIRDEGIGAMAAVPLVYEGDVLGVAYAALRDQADVGDTVLAQMEEIAAPTATALHLADRLVGQASAALAAERQRIAVALHDSVGAMLFGLSAEVHDLQSDVLAAPELVARLRSVERRIAETAAVFRESLAVLDVVSPDQVLSATLRGDCEDFTRRTGVVARCVALTDIPPIHGAQCAALVAVVREALVNVEKHADATSVVVSLVATDGGVSVAVADDGLGWPDAAEASRTAQLCTASSRAVSESSTGIGLRSSHDRLARLGGVLSVVGNDDGGLTVRAWVPA